jgi:hypothetical protein
MCGSQPAGIGRWLAADRRIDFRIGTNLGGIRHEEQETRLPKTSLGPILIVRAGGTATGEGQDRAELRGPVP